MPRCDEDDESDAYEDNDSDLLTVRYRANAVTDLVAPQEQRTPF